MPKKPPFPQSPFLAPARIPAAHVQAAVMRAAQAKMPDPSVAVRSVAPHVQSALARAAQAKFSHKAQVMVGSFRAAPQRQTAGTCVQASSTKSGSSSSVAAPVEASTASTTVAPTSSDSKAAVSPDIIKLLIAVANECYTPIVYQTCPPEITKTRDNEWKFSWVCRFKAPLPPQSPYFFVQKVALAVDLMQGKAPKLAGADGKTYWEAWPGSKKGVMDGSDDYSFWIADGSKGSHTVTGTVVIHAESKNADSKEGELRGLQKGNSKTFAHELLSTDQEPQWWSSAEVFCSYHCLTLLWDTTGKTKTFTVRKTVSKFSTEQTKEVGSDTLRIVFR